MNSFVLVRFNLIHIVLVIVRIIHVFLVFLPVVHMLLLSHLIWVHLVSVFVF